MEKTCNTVITLTCSKGSDVISASLSYSEDYHWVSWKDIQFPAEEIGLRRAGSWTPRRAFVDSLVQQLLDKFKVELNDWLVQRNHQAFAFDRNRHEDECWRWDGPATYQVTSKVLAVGRSQNFLKQEDVTSEVWTILVQVEDGTSAPLPPRELLFVYMRALSGDLCPVCCGEVNVVPNGFCSFECGDCGQDWDTDYIHTRIDLIRPFLPF